MYCDQCGAKNSDDAKFCVTCGGKIGGGEEITLAPARAAATERSEQTREQLIGDLSRATDTIYQLVNAQEEYIAANVQLKDMYAEVEKLKSGELSNASAGMGAVVAFVAMFFLVRAFQSFALPIFISFIIWLISTVIFEMTIFHRENRPEDEMKAEEYKNEHEPACLAAVEEKKKELEELAESEDVKHMQELVPADYLTLDTISFLLLMLKNRRADNLKEAINLYEESLRQAKMEEMQQEQIKLLVQNIDVGKQQLSAQEKMIKGQAAQLKKADKLNRRVMFSNVVDIVNTVKHWSD